MPEPTSLQPLTEETVYMLPDGRVHYWTVLYDSAMNFIGGKMVAWRIDGSYAGDLQTSPSDGVCGKDVTLTPGPHTIKAYFRGDVDYEPCETDVFTIDVTEPPVQYTLNVTVTAGGSTNPAPGDHLYDEGTIASVRAIPDSGYTLDHWMQDDVDVGDLNPILVLMDADHSVKAVFTVIPVILHPVDADSAPSLMPYSYDGSQGVTPNQHLVEEGGSLTLMIPVEVEQ